jgi:uncharacterized iron-regulated protein
MVNFPRLLATLCMTLGLGVQLACSGVPPLQLRDLTQQPVLLLGEVHDNAALHMLRAEALRELLQTGARPALVMEQFDREQQDGIDRALRSDASVSANVDGLIAAAGNNRWDWALYWPVLALAVQYRLPVIAGNVSRADAKHIMADGLAAHGFDAQVPAEITSVLTREIEQSHCGMVKPAVAQRMVLAQVARDQWMARMIAAHATRGVVLLVGNGHVRTDVGVPRWLVAPLRSQIQAIGFLEQGDAPTAEYDRVFYAPSQPRPDPCEAMRKLPTPAVVTP